MPYRESKLDQLPAEKQEEIVVLSRDIRLFDLVKILEEQGVETSMPALSRFLKRAEERRLLDEAEEEGAAMVALATGRDRRKFRKGTLAVLQARLYEEAVASRDLETIQKCYKELAAEEDRAEGLELNRKRVELAALNADLGRRKLEVAMELARGRKRVQVTSAPAAIRELGEGTSTEPLIAANERTEEQPKQQLASKSEEQLRVALQCVEAALNRGGDPVEKLLEARQLLAEKRKEIG